MTPWDNSGPSALISKFELHLQQGSYQTTWQEILDATDPNDDRDVELFEEQAQNITQQTSSQKMNGLKCWPTTSTLDAKNQDLL